MVNADISSWTNKVNIDSVLGKNRKETAKPGDTFANRDLNILVLGSDYRAQPEYDQHGQLVTGMRSDTTMVAHISADRTRVEVMSIPRDLMVKRPACINSKGRNIPESSGNVQFNSVFAELSDGTDIATGTACTIKTVEQLTGIFIDEFVVVDFDGFQEMVAALGGVHICIDKPMKDSFGNINLPAGCHVLDPQQALGFARARYGVGDGSDISRIGRQQQLIGAMMKEAKSRNLLTDLPSLYAFLRAGMRSLTTSETFGNAKNLGGLAFSLAKVKPENIRFYTLPFGEYAPDRARVAVADNAVDMFDALRLDKRVPPYFPYQDMNGNLHEPSEQAPASSLSPDSASSGGSVPSQGNSSGRTGGSLSRGTSGTSGANSAHSGQTAGGSTNSNPTGNNVGNTDTPAHNSGTANNPNSVGTGESGGNSANNVPSGETSGGSGTWQDPQQ
ncbi:LCP family protein [uncultured Mobiluncus sp.]|uniref:LCP family protein n=1 Tax=uncultured Mobiluncus sp. TaxID=293425 RepID=UPI00260DEECB|nr:LCP family protein [uncultured Mobiluncus sp.]